MDGWLLAAESLEWFDQAGSVSAVHGCPRNDRDVISGDAICFQVFPAMESKRVEVRL